MTTLKKKVASRTTETETWLETEPGYCVALPEPDAAQKLLKRPAPLPHTITLLPPAKAKGLVIQWGLHETPLGRALVAICGKHLIATSFVVKSDRNTQTLFEEQWQQNILVQDQQATAPWVKKVFTKNPKNLPLLLVGSDFHQSVWQALFRIPAGTVVRYGDLAKAIGRPRAARAIGNAVGANHIGWVVPCHRVVHSDGSMRGFGWGEAVKRRFLAFEG